MATDDVLKDINNTTNMTETYQDAIVGAINTIVESKLSNLKYDTTIEAAIINSDEWETGKYYVRTGDSAFYAYDNTGSHYAVNEVVYVNVPQGDYKNKKFIIGRKTDETENEVYNYQFPFENFIQLNQLTNIQGERNYRANQPDPGQTEAVDGDAWLLYTYSPEEGLPTIGTKLGITADITSLLMDYRPQQGNYGIIVKLRGVLNNTTGEDSNPRFEREYKLDISQMYGNPYSFPTPTTQQTMYDISDIVSITEISVSFWQDLENPFIDEYGEEIPWHYTFTDDDGNILDNTTLVQPNLILSNVGVYTGFDTTEITTDKVFLYTYDDQTYGREPDNPAQRQNFDERSLHMAMVHKNTDGSFSLYQTEEQFEAAGAEIYWYIKTPDWYLDSDLNPAYDSLKTYHKYGGVYWAPMSLDNAPDPIIGDSENIYNKCNFTFMADIARSSYKYRVAVAINGTHVMSDIVSFDNEKDVESESQSIAVNNKVILRTGVLLYSEDGLEQVLYPDDSFENFFVYDENNNVLHTDDNRTVSYHLGTASPKIYHWQDNIPFSDITFFTEIWVRDDYNKIQSDYRELGNYVRLSDWKDSYGNYVPFTVEWDLPSDDQSMLQNVRTLDGTYSTTSYYMMRNSIPVIRWDGVQTNVETAFDVDKLTTVTFNIRNAYDYLRLDNTISCKITRNGQTYTAKREFMFGRALAQGCDYTPTIHINVPEGNSYILPNTNFELQCIVYDSYGKKVTDSYECTWSFLGRQLPTIIEYADVVLSEATLTEDASIGTDAIFRGRTKNSTEPFVVTVEVKGLVDYTLHTRRGMRMASTANFLQTHTVVCPDRIEFNSTGQAPKYYTGHFICKINGVVDNEHGISDPERFFYPDWKIHVEEDGLADIIHLKAYDKYQSAFYPQPSNETYDSEKDYWYFDYHIMDYVRYDPEDDDNNKTNFSDLTLKNLMFYKEVLKYNDFYNLQGELTTKAPNVSEYSLICQPGGVNNIQGGVDSAWQWKDEYASEIQYLTWLSFEYNGIIFTQAIAYDRYVYPSSLINSWDGVSLTLDTENGAVLATMIAAGTKDSITGKYTGVMMGNWTTKGDDSFDNGHRTNASGIYGFLDGESSFAFLDDGTGYIGPSGAGRIQFDGRNALISNSTQSCYINLNPNRLYEDGEGWNDVTNSGISSYFLYCRVPIDANALLGLPVKTGNNEYSYDYLKAEASLSWADPFLKDTNNNYFVVDPQHGTLMSGGIVSKYGRIGNWYINDSGLYQKYIAANSQDDKTGNRFVYLGMPSFNAFTKRDQIQKHYINELEANEHNRLVALGQTVDLTPSENAGETLIIELLPYLKADSFQMDVYHYFNSYLAVKWNLDYFNQVFQAYDSDMNYEAVQSYGANLYDGEALLENVFNYEHMNSYNHNHYTEDNIPYNVQVGIHNNLENVLGVDTSWWYANVNSNFIRIVNYYNSELGYTYYKNYSSSTFLVNEDESLYYTTNQIGIIRAASYYPWDRITDKELTLFSQANSHPYVQPENLPYESLQEWYESADNPGISENDLTPSVSGQRGINFSVCNDIINYYEKPRLDPRDTNQIILNRIWDDTSNKPRANSFYYYINNIKFNNYYINLSYFLSVKKDLEIYCNYFNQLYNQTLFYMLEQGLEDIRQSDPEKYALAMERINLLGGLEHIKEVGIEYIGSATVDIEIEGLSEEDIARIQKIRTDSINAYYDKLKEEIELQRAVDIENIYTQFDADKYAMYVGYNSPLDALSLDQSTSYLDPLFGVKWNGYLIARHGRIGHESPWYISDAGLTQKNNFGTIFLGSPDQDGSSGKYETTYARDASGNIKIDSAGDPIVETKLLGTRTVFIDADGNEITAEDGNGTIGILLPNGSEIGGKKAIVEGGEYYNNLPSGTNFSQYELVEPGTTYASGLNTVIDNNINYPYSATDKKYLGPEAFGEYGQFAIYAGDRLNGIRFGVRLDGTVYASRLQVKNIKVTGGDINGVSASSMTVDNSTGDRAMHTFATAGKVKICDSQFTAEEVYAGGHILVNYGYIYVLGADEPEHQSLGRSVITDSVIGNVQVDRVIVYDYDYTKDQVDLSETTSNLNTNVTIVDSSGTRYYYRKRVYHINNGESTESWEWVCTSTGYGGYSARSYTGYQNMLATIANADSILLGGSLSGWIQDSTQIVSYKINPALSALYTENGETRYVRYESVALDANQGEIRLANSRVVLDGINGIIFVGQPNARNNTGEARTDAHLIMADINTSVSTVGITTYTSTLIGSNSVIAIDTTQTRNVGEDHTYTGTTENSGDEGDSNTDGGTIHGTTTLNTIVTSANSTNIITSSRSYGGGFYTISYQQIDALTTVAATLSNSNSPNSPVVACESGLGIAFSNNNSGFVALYPFADDSQLGLISGNNNNYRWNILATRITAYNGIWIVGSDGTLDPVVCKSAFDSAIASLQESLDAIGNSLGNTAGDVADALSTANSALSRANSALRKAIKTVEITEVNNSGGFKGIKVVLTTIANSSIESSIEKFATEHTHEWAEFEISNGGIAATIGSVQGGTAVDRKTGWICSQSSVDLSADASGSGSAILNIADHDVTFNLDVSTAMETAFKNGWNAALAALTWSSTSETKSQTGAGSQSATITVSATGGDGKNNYSKTITLSLSNTNASASLGGEDNHYADWDWAGSSIKRNGTTYHSDVDVWLAGGDSHYGYVSSQGTASASITVT